MRDQVSTTLAMEYERAEMRDRPGHYNWRGRGECPDLPEEWVHLEGRIDELQNSLEERFIYLECRKGILVF